MEKTTTPPQTKTLKILIKHYTWMAHEKAATGKPFYEIVGELVEAEAERRSVLEHVK